MIPAVEIGISLPNDPKTINGNAGKLMVNIVGIPSHWNGLVWLIANNIPSSTAIAIAALK